MLKPIHWTWIVPGIVAAGLCAGGFISHANAGGSYSPDMIGALVWAYLLWLLAIAAGITSAIAFVVTRSVRRNVERGFPVMTRPQHEKREGS